jgi:hypothetical protein
MYLGSRCDRPLFWLLKGWPQRALYFTGRGRDRVRAIDFRRCCAQPNHA